MSIKLYIYNLIGLRNFYIFTINIRICFFSQLFKHFSWIKGISFSIVTTLPPPPTYCGVKFQINFLYNSHPEENDSQSTLEFLKSGSYWWREKMCLWECRKKNAILYCDGWEKTRPRMQLTGTRKTHLGLSTKHLTLKDRHIDHTTKMSTKCNIFYVKDQLHSPGPYRGGIGELHL